MSRVPPAGVSPDPQLAAYLRVGMAAVRAAEAAVGAPIDGVAWRVPSLPTRKAVGTALHELTEAHLLDD